MDKNKCPKLKNQNTFHFRKTRIFSTHEGKNFPSFSENLKNFSSECSILVFKLFCKYYNLNPNPTDTPCEVTNTPGRKICCRF
jgi:hypothetical protein